MITELESDSKIVELEAARRTDQGIPPDLQAIASSEATASVAAMQAERLARPVDGPPKTNNWSRRFTLMVLIGLVMGLGVLAYFTLEYLSAPPESPAASRIKVPEKLQPPVANRSLSPAVGEKKAAIEQDVPAKPATDPMAAVFDRPAPAATATPEQPKDIAAPATPSGVAGADPAVPSSSVVPRQLAPVPTSDSSVSDGVNPATPAASTPDVPADPESTAKPPMAKTGESDTAPSAPNVPAPVAASSPPSAETKPTVLAPQEKAVVKPAPKPPIGNFSAQLGAVKDPGVAKREQLRLSARLKDILGVREVEIVEAVIKNRGTFYRLRIPGFVTRSKAGQFCLKAKQKRVSCVPVRS